MRIAQDGSTEHGESVTVGQLLARGALPATEVLGGDEATGRRVSVVVPGTTARAIATLPAGAMVVFDRSQLRAEEVEVDLAIRIAFRAQIAGIVAQHPSIPMPLATQRLAAKFRVPIVLLDHVEVSGVVAALEPHVRAPTIAGAKLLRATIAAMSSLPADSGELLERLAGALRHPVGLVDSDGQVIAGDLPALTGALRAGFAEFAAAPGGHTARTLWDTDELLLVQSATVAAASSPGLWLAARLPSESSDHVRDGCAQSLAVAAIAFTAYLAERSVVFERESRHRTLLLAELLEHPETPRQRAVEQATSLGWRLAGWHSAVYVAVRSVGDPTGPGGVAALVEGALKAHDVQARLVERPSGWAFWMTTEAEPTVRAAGEQARTVRRALLEVERTESPLRLCAGIGGAHQGIGGLGRSLQEADQACMLAHTIEAAAPVEHVETSSVKRLLIAWYTSGPLGEVVAALLEPLQAGDPDGELIRTLRVYLDNESSATAAGAALDVHRNTILNRLEKIQRLLPVDLTQPDHRLAVHLAVHAAGDKSNWSEGRRR